ncbi:unnamed protein product [Aphanomyces euteiches]|uniref:Uncharacterized protein n=1 Tax=Aphanomyces euteiches TaxID=100861 RepID=A0A6G0XTI2_9STRA|nr:hypothetical protein Ae201684_001476 [Aphanomyces euteiches]KAH9075432.1 hypothetical protein Ae201684P_004112 [Aphanomyces euteiches]KAH9141345.1 hypothetical protein AeRB84_014546 [Aphanomyces euteiches]
MEEHRRGSKSHIQPVTTLDADYDDAEYDTLHQDPRGDDILDDSEFFTTWMGKPSMMNDLCMFLAANQGVQTAVHVVSSLIGRWTCWKANWETETLRSFLEVLVWTSVTAVAYSIHRDALWAAQIGLTVGIAMSICDEVFVAGARSLLESIEQLPNGAALLRKWGFDVRSSVDKDAKTVTTTSSQDVQLIKNVVFGALALEAIRHVYLSSTQDVQHFSAVTTAMGVAFVVIGELFCLWLPTRQLGLTVQSRWTNISENWQNHFVRSLVEVTCWLLCLLYVYATTASIGNAVLWSSVLGVGFCIIGGLDPLDAKDSSVYVSSYWAQWAGHGWLDTAEMLLSIVPKVE